jgi:hypothetical protein
MKYKNMRITFLLLSLLVNIHVHAQTLAVKKIELADEKIIVYYALEDSNPHNEYQISLYASQNNFTKALTKVSGDVGNEVKAGALKKIEWNILDELGPYKGRLSLEVRGRAFVPVAKISNIFAGNKFKRGKSKLILWKPGTTSKVNIELMKGGQRISGEPGLVNNGSFNLHIPQHAALGKDYSIRITDTGNPENIATSLPFTVKRKFPMILKVIPAFAIGGALMFLKGSGSAEGGGSTSQPIPDPPTLPGN